MYFLVNFGVFFEDFVNLLSDLVGLELFIPLKRNSSSALRFDIKQ